MRAITATTLALLALGLAACGGGDSDPRDVGADAKEPEPKQQTTRTETSRKTTQPKGLPTVERGEDNDRKIEISASDFPDGTWPLTIESGELRCEDTKTTRTIIFSSGGQDYPINGVPKGGEIIGIEPIWKKKEDPDSPGTRMDITPLFKKGYELCD